MTRILIVDDDRNVLNGVLRILSEDRTLEIKTCTSTDAALASVMETRYDIVISDYRMPGCDGISFLKNVKALQPRAVRIVLSGYCDKTSLYCAINEVQAHRYIEKPCDATALRAVITQVLQEREAALAHDAS